MPIDTRPDRPNTDGWLCRRLGIKPGPSNFHERYCGSLQPALMKSGSHAIPRAALHSALPRIRKHSRVNGHYGVSQYQSSDS
jgi:hypothetical protein